MSNLSQTVRQTRERLVSVVRELDPSMADWVARRAVPEVSSVVIVGETNRGKSSLVNALLSAPGLSPVDADVATSTYLVFQHGPSWAARGDARTRVVPRFTRSTATMVTAEPTRTPTVGASSRATQSTMKAPTSWAASMAIVVRSTPMAADAAASDSTIVTPSRPPA